MSSSNGVRRIKTYGKHKSSVAVSRREWWNTVSEGGGAASTAASTSTATTLDSDTYSKREATSPSHRAAKKAAHVIDLDDEDEDYVPSPPPRKHVPRAQSRSINNRSRIVDLSNDDSEEEYNTAASQSRRTTLVSEAALLAETPANAVLKLSTKASDQQEPPGRRRVVSLSSETSEESRVRNKPAKSKVPSTTKGAVKPKKRIIIDDSPPPSPLPPANEHVVVDLQDEDVAHVEAVTTPLQASLVEPPVLLKPAVLGRKDSNLSKRTPSVSSSPFKKPPAPSVSPAKPVKSMSKATISSAPVAIFKENVALSSKPGVSAVTPTKPVKATLKASSKHPLIPSRLSASSSNSSRSSSSTKSTTTSSSSSGIALPPPRGHNSSSTVAWRRPLAPISAARPKTKVSTLSSIARKVESASPVPVRSAMPLSHGNSRSSASRVVVEIPFGLPRSRSPAPSSKEPRRRQTSSQSTASTSSRSSVGHEHSPLAAVHCAGSSSPPSVSSQSVSPEASSLSASTPGTLDGSIDDALPPVNPQVSALLASLQSKDDVPRDFESLLEHCDGVTSGSTAAMLDFASFITNPLPLYPHISAEESNVRWSKLGEATFSEVFIVTSSEESPNKRAGIVVKVIPLHMSSQQAFAEEKVEEAFARDQDKRDEAFTTSVDDLAREIRIFRALSEQETAARKGWPGFKGAYLVRGAYPETLLSAWDAFKVASPKKAENPRPDTFASNQMFALICMEHAGVDLESVKLKTWAEAATVLWQVSSALSQAERNLQFEHRDLHWGNILVQRHAEENQLESESADDLPGCLSSISTSVSATIIDFTLSRADVPVAPKTRPTVGLQALSGGFDDEWMFTGEGDYQYECYRIMKRLVENNWEQYRPATNVVWLHYLVQKLLQDKGLKKPLQRAATRTVAIRATLPGTPLKSRTRRGAAAVRKAVNPTSLEEHSTEREAYESLLAARNLLGDAIAGALKSLPRSISLTEMMADLKMSNNLQDSDRQEGRFNSAGDFVNWWRSV